MCQHYRGRQRYGRRARCANSARKVHLSTGVRRGRRTGRARWGVVPQSLVGKVVVDPEGIEIGFVAHADPRYLTIGGGPGATIRLGQRFVGSVADRVTLKAPIYELFENLNVIDREGEFVGVVRDTIDAEDVFDSIVVEDEDGRLLTVLTEDIRSIDEFVEISASAEELEAHEAAGG